MFYKVHYPDSCVVCQAKFNGARICTVTVDFPERNCDFNFHEECFKYKSGMSYNDFIKYNAFPISDNVWSELTGEEW